MNSRNPLTILAAVLSFLFLAGCASTEGLRDQEISGTLFFWQDETLSLIQKYQLNPLRASRVLASLHSAALEVRDGAVASTLPCRSAEMDRAQAGVLEYFFPLEVPGRFRALLEIRKSGAERCDFALAEKTVAAVIARAKADGAFPPRKIRQNPHPYEGEWKPTFPLFINTPTEPFAGEWKMYFAESPAAYVMKGPLAPSSTQYREAVDEVLNVANSLSAAHRQIAEDWNLDAGSVTPPGVWNQRLREMLKSQPSQVDQVRLYASLNKAMYDAMVVCWHYKYFYWTERPITAAERLQMPPLRPALVTPPFPSYPSGHSTVSGAAAEVISAYVPKFSVEANRLAGEAAISRLWGGIHFTFDNEDGLELGRQVGKAAVKALPPVSSSNR